MVFSVVSAILAAEVIAISSLGLAIDYELDSDLNLLYDSYSSVERAENEVSECILRMVYDLNPYPAVCIYAGIVIPVYSLQPY